MRRIVRVKSSGDMFKWVMAGDDDGDGSGRGWVIVWG
jgi:hypothetical protein